MYVTHPSPNPHRKTIMITAIIASALVAIVLAGAIVFVALNKHGGSKPPAQNSQGQQAQLADQYTGTSRNITAEQLGLNGRATIKLTFTSKSPQALSGDIQVTGRDLGGTGIFDGTLVGNRITLNVHPTDGVPAFKLVGTVAADGSISGSLDVPGDAAVPAQTGSWTAQPVSR